MKIQSQKKAESHLYGFYLEGKTGVSLELCPKKGRNSWRFSRFRKKEKSKMWKKVIINWIRVRVVLLQRQVVCLTVTLVCISQYMKKSGLSQAALDNGCKMPSVLSR